MRIRAGWNFRKGQENIDESNALGMQFAMPLAAPGMARSRSISIVWDMAETVFRSATLPVYATKTWNSLPNSEQLSDDSFGAGIQRQSSMHLYRPAL